MQVSESIFCWPLRQSKANQTAVVTWMLSAVKLLCESIFSLGMEDDGPSVLFASLKLRRENVKWVEKRKVEKIKWSCETNDTPTRSAASTVKEVSAV